MSSKVTLITAGWLLKPPYSVRAYAQNDAISLFSAEMHTISMFPEGNSLPTPPAF